MLLLKVSLFCSKIYNTQSTTMPESIKTRKAKFLHPLLKDRIVPSFNKGRVGSPVGLRPRDGF
ncbi:MAG TPA: hypothetical protein PLW95_02270 [bacterium]|nr:hypothetical protein [bacterium]